MADKNCPHFGKETPYDFDCSECAIQKKCYWVWQETYDAIIESCLSNLITYNEANEKLKELGCEVPDNVL